MACVVGSILSSVLNPNDRERGGRGTLTGALGNMLNSGSDDRDGRRTPVSDGERAYHDVYMSDLARGTEGMHHQASFTHEGVASLLQEGATVG
jgi:hypothetical protein